MNLIIMIKYSFRLLIGKPLLLCYWQSGKNNLGDVLNPILVKFLTGNIPIQMKPKRFPFSNYLIIGSVIHKAGKNSIIWGAGCLGEEYGCKVKPIIILAVRGPKTRDVLQRDGVECPEVYGDPALLLPLFYFPKKNKKFKIGIVPHYVDKDAIWFQNFKSTLPQDIVLLDVQEKNTLEYIDKMLECEMIVSSSLHGLILSDAYKIPSVWVKFSDRILGGSFKFLDYFMSVGRVDMEPILLKDEYLLNKISSPCLVNVVPNIKALLETMPFETAIIANKDELLNVYIQKIAL